jgi:hypothetical protein
MVGEIGDGTLTSFHSAIDAVNCARKVQVSLQQDQPDLKVRIGIHLGDVMFSNNTVLGDGVNIASRIHALAPPVGICVSASIYDEIRNKPGTRFKDLGERNLKNVSRPIRVFQVSAASLIEQPAGHKGHQRRNALIAGAGAVILAGLALVFMCLRSPAPASPQALSVANKGTIILDEVFGRHSEKSANRARLDSFGSGVIQSRIGRAAAPDHIGLDDRQRRACRNCSNPSYTKAGSSRSMAGKVSFSRQ